MNGDFAERSAGIVDPLETLSSLSWKLRAYMNETFNNYGNYDNPPLGYATMDLIGSIAAMSLPMHQDYEGDFFMRSTSANSPSSLHKDHIRKEIGLSNDEVLQVYKASLNLIKIEKRIGAEFDPPLAITCEQWSEQRTIWSHNEAVKREAECEGKEVDPTALMKDLSLPEPINNEVSLDLRATVPEKIIRELLAGHRNAIFKAWDKCIEYAQQSDAPADLISDMKLYRDLAQDQIKATLEKHAQNGANVVRDVPFGKRNGARGRHI